VLGHLGPEPLSEAFTPALFYERLKGRRRAIKPLILDQSFLAGVGNIYSDEALHQARLHPLRIASTLNEAEAERLYHALRQVLYEGIRTQGASIDWVYRGGEFQNNFNVYQRTGNPCKVCGTPVQRLVVGQRGTHICPVCQPES
jgi:formamidopyrimidine-DNA glycosylase